MWNRKYLRPAFLRPSFVATTVFAIGLMASLQAHANIIVTVGDATLVAGSSGALDVTLTNTGPTTSLAVDAFFFRVSTSDTFVTFTSVNTSTAPPYIFQSNSLFGPTISTIPPPDGQLVDASDIALLGVGTTLPAGSTVGLGHVLFNVASNATPGVASLVLNAAGTSLADIAGNDIPISALVNGQITISNAVPEPPNFALLALSLGAGALSRLLQRTVWKQLVRSRPTAVSKVVSYCQICNPSYVQQIQNAITYPQ